jgi:hypothetical protein
MDRRITFALSSVLLFAGIAVLPGDAVAQQAASATHKYMYRAVLTTEGVKDLQKRSATGLRTNIVKFTESLGCKQEFWYFDPLNSTAYGAVDCPDEMAVATITTTVNAAPYARLTYWSVLTAEEMDKAATRAASSRPPQQQ